MAPDHLARAAWPKHRQRWNSVVVLKGAITYIAGPGTKVWRHEGGNIDVPDLDVAVEFDRSALALRAGRRLFGGTVAEMLGASSDIFLVVKEACCSSRAGDTTKTREAPSATGKRFAANPNGTPESKGCGQLD